MTVQSISSASSISVLEAVLAWGTLRQSFLETRGCKTDGLIVIRRGDRLEIPSWQLVRDDNMLVANRLVLEVNHVLSEFRPNSELISAWWLTPHTLLNRKTPLSQLGEIPDDVFERAAKATVRLDRALHIVRPGMTSEEIMASF